MPSNTQEQKHYHNLSQQFFYILNGTTTFKIEDQTIEITKIEGLHIKPKIQHQIMNLASSDLEFLVISQPTSKGGRINLVQ